jgi:hypothetical protein
VSLTLPPLSVVAMCPRASGAIGPAHGVTTTRDGSSK